MPPKFKSLFLSTLLFLSMNSMAQSEKAFCKAVNKGNFNKIERIVRKAIRKNSKATILDNGHGDTYRSCAPNLDSVTAWLHRFDCVEEAYWDKCQMKLDIFPGYSSIGIKVTVDNEIIEKCFLIREGSVSRLNIFCFSLIKGKTKLIFEEMNDCSGFIEQQKKNCEEHDKKLRKM